MEPGPTYEEWLRGERAAEERNREAFTGAKGLDWLEIGTRGQFVPLEEEPVVGRWGVEEHAEKVSESVIVNEDGSWVFRTEFAFR
jgi:hypothetical protein